AGGHRCIRVVAHLCRQIERNAEPGLAVVQQVVIPAVRLLRRTEAGILAHRPEPAAVHRRIHTARERELAREADRLIRPIGRIQPLDGEPARGLESLLPLRLPLQERPDGLALPACALAHTAASNSTSTAPFSTA